MANLKKFEYRIFYRKQDDRGYYRNGFYSINDEEYRWNTPAMKFKEFLKQLGDLEIPEEFICPIVSKPGVVATIQRIGPRCFIETGLTSHIELAIVID